MRPYDDLFFPMTETNDDVFSRQYCRIVFLRGGAGKGNNDISDPQLL